MIRPISTTKTLETLPEYLRKDGTLCMAYIGIRNSRQAITLSMYARRKEWPLQHIHVQLDITKEEKGTPMHTQIKRVIELHGDLDAAQRERLLGVANACPLHKLLSGNIVIDSQLAE